MGPARSRILIGRPDKQRFSAGVVSRTWRCARGVFLSNAKSKQMILPGFGGPGEFGVPARRVIDFDLRGSFGQMTERRIFNA